MTCRCNGRTLSQPVHVIIIHIVGAPLRSHVQHLLRLPFHRTGTLCAAFNAYSFLHSVSFNLIFFRLAQRCFNVKGINLFLSFSQSSSTVNYYNILYRLSIRQSHPTSGIRFINPCYCIFHIYISPFPDSFISFQLLCHNHLQFSLCHKYVGVVKYFPTPTIIKKFI